MFEIKHFSDFERLAMIVETKWEHGMATFRKPFTKATIRYFDHTAASEARKWLGIAAPAARPRMRCEVLGGLRPARAEKP